MGRCVAVRRKGSTDPCEANAVRGHTLCGRHAKMLAPVLWVDTNRSSVVRIQAHIRGWLVRRRLSYAGFGVLSRKGLTNDDDVISYVEKGRVHPMDYISFEENGKHWWFEFGSLWSWCTRNADPTNPYTKVVLSSDTRKRLRTIWGYKVRHREDLPIESTIFEERLRNRTYLLTQHFADYGFVGIDPNFLQRLTRGDCVLFFVMLDREIDIAIPSSHPFHNRLRVMCKHKMQSVQHHSYVLQCVNTILYVVSLYRDPYILTFSILSVLYRI